MTKALNNLINNVDKNSNYYYSKERLNDIDFVVNEESDLDGIKSALSKFANGTISVFDCIDEIDSILNKGIDRNI